MPARQSYEMVIGLEVHVQLSTLSKAFCADDAAFGGEPNTHISAISLAHPGTLPRANAQHIEYAVRLGLALGCHIQQTNAFDRKNYFYADLPKGYQITQDKKPVCTGGGLEIQLPGYSKYIRLHHIHMEEDAGKSIHDLDPVYSYVDLNRAGVPLLEIVTEPDLRSPEEVEVFMTAMRQLVRYLEISDGNMEEGSLRCDCNISVRQKGDTRLNQRCEIKNMNSMKFARRALEFEFQRQSEMMESGRTVEQQTLHFDPVTGITSPLRDKENAHDYRYFPDPDLPPVVISQEHLMAIKAAMPALPRVMEDKFVHTYGLPHSDALQLSADKTTALYFDALALATGFYKATANLVIHKILPWCEEQGLSLAEFPLKATQLTDFLGMIESGKVSHSIAYQRILPVLLEQPDASPLALAESMNLLQSTDEAWMTDLVREVLARYPDKVKEYYKGKKGLIGFFMGELMKVSKGRIDPKTANALLERTLKEM